MTEPAITPEEAAALWEQFVIDSESERLRLYAEDPANIGFADSHALALAVQRERERCAKIVKAVAEKNAEDARLVVSIQAAKEIDERIRSGE